MTPMEHRIEHEEKRRKMAERKLKEALHEIEILNSKLIYLQEGLKSPVPMTNSKVNNAKSHWKLSLFYILNKFFKI